MGTALFRFYEELNNFLPLGDRKVDRPFVFSGELTVGEAIDARGVPRALVELILVNGEPAGFERPLADGDRVSVYPVFESFDLHGATPHPP